MKSESRKEAWQGRWWSREKNRIVIFLRGYAVWGDAEELELGDSAPSKEVKRERWEGEKEREGRDKVSREEVDGELFPQASR